MAVPSCCAVGYVPALAGSSSLKDISVPVGAAAPFGMEGDDGLIVGHLRCGGWTTVEDVTTWNGSKALRYWEEPHCRCRQRFPQKFLHRRKARKQRLTTWQMQQFDSTSRLQKLEARSPAGAALGCRWVPTRRLRSGNNGHRLRQLGPSASFEPMWVQRRSGPDTSISRLPPAGKQLKGFSTLAKEEHL